MSEIALTREHFSTLFALATPKVSNNPTSLPSLLKALNLRLPKPLGKSEDNSGFPFLSTWVLMENHNSHSYPIGYPFVIIGYGSNRTCFDVEQAFGCYYEATRIHIGNWVPHVHESTRTYMLPAPSSDFLTSIPPGAHRVDPSRRSFSSEAGFDFMMQIFNAVISRPQAAKA